MSKWLLTAPLLLLYSIVLLADSKSPHTIATDLAISALAKEQGIDIDAIQVDSVKAVQWPDSSLGCPQPGMMYAQVIIQGFLVTLFDRTKGTSHTVHIGKGKAIVCNKSASTRSQTEKNLRFGQRWQQSQQAQKLLAERLSVAQNEIRITGNKNIPADKLPDTCKAKQGATSATVIELNHHGKSFRYAVFGGRLYSCD